ncbi:helix-turn-helix domain-containing protein [Lipingzhangella sp. LS1_29]|uniref:Helix-turn-helix domain-containing protein n=1 Tax=Lipingzhangella rawalii TaxID=2055835 RepID=A0ABU2H5M1_9ACTN|nr:helix-turn-helix domain-containing protein [Lipingzhangella rawalii]MDS1270302.1 helix-turn-helix domain-containing protein [Lipingzhangella rawalii]
MRIANPLSVAELVRSGPLAEARPLGTAGLDGEVHSVRLLDELAPVTTGIAHAVLVVTERAARGGWTVEATVRTAWERAAACVVIPASSAATSTELVASRLGVPVLAVDRSTQDVGLELAAAVARPDAARAVVTARCANRLAEAGASARPILGVLNRELPGVDVALVTPSGAIAAGRTSAARLWGECAAAAATDAGAPEATLAANRLVSAPVPGPGRREFGHLVALVHGYSTGWAATVRGVLRLAAGLLTGWASTTRLQAEREPRVAAVTLRRILSGIGEESTAPVPGDGAVSQSPRPEDTTAELRLASWGWPTTGPMVAVAVVPATVEPAASPEPGVAAAPPAPGPDGATSVIDHSREVNAVWSRHLTTTLIPYADGWVSCHAVSEQAGFHTRLVRQVEDAVHELAPLVELVAGVGRVETGTARLAATIRSSWEAARDARSCGPGAVVRAGTLGPRRLLAGIPAELVGPAREVLADVLAADPDRVLITTLAVVLDHGGSVQEAAARLGVHRNTVTARLDRLRSLGADPQSPQQRLALHLACHLLREQPGTEDS